MAKKKMSDYEMDSIRKTVNNLSGPQSLMSTALARHYLSDDELIRFKNQKRLEMVLNLCETPEEIQAGFNQVDWDALDNVCNILFASGNLTAINLAPIQWWDSVHSQVYDNDYSYNNIALFGDRSVENEWLTRCFFNYKAYHNFSSIRIHHSFGGEVVGKKIQNAVWDMLKSKGLTGSTTITSSVFCGVPANRKILDVCLVQNAEFEHIQELIDSTNWDQKNSKEETLFALTGVSCDETVELKLLESLGQHFKGHIFNFDQEFGGDIKFQNKVINDPEQSVSLVMAALRRFIGTKTPENMEHIKQQAIAYYSALPEDKQIQTASWFYENHSGYYAPEKIRNLKEIIKHSAPKTIDHLVHKIAYDQWENNQFSDGEDQQVEMTELANVLKQFSRYKKPLLGKEFLNWVVNIGKDWSLSQQDMGDIQYLKSWCKHPETFLELVTSHQKCSGGAKELQSWVEASKIRIELADTPQKQTTPRKRKI